MSELAADMNAGLRAEVYRLREDNLRLVAALESATRQIWEQSGRADAADKARVTLEGDKIHPAFAVDVQEHRSQAYQGGWVDGYAEGFGRARSEFRAKEKKG